MGAMTITKCYTSDETKDSNGGWWQGAGRVGAFTILLSQRRNLVDDGMVGFLRPFHHGDKHEFANDPGQLRERIHRCAAHELLQFSAKGNTILHVMQS